MQDRRRSALGFWLLCALAIWATHATAYFFHEYWHSLVAWVAGFRANPLAIDYGHLTPGNILVQSEVDDAVPYDAIFGRGKDAVAALIAFAGMGFGNGLLYAVSRVLLRSRTVRHHSSTYLFGFWLCLMNVGNFLDYVPVRTFVSHGDMAYVARGLHVSPWVILVALGYPTAWALVHFLRKVLPDMLCHAAPQAMPHRVALVAITVFILFGYYGSAGFTGYGEVSHTLSAISMLSCPIILAECWPAGDRQVRGSSGKESC